MVTTKPLVATVVGTQASRGTAEALEFVAFVTVLPGAVLSVLASCLLGMLAARGDVLAAVAIGALWSTWGLVSLPLLLVSATRR